MGLAVSEMRKGMVILYDGELYEIVDYEHSKRGRGGAIARTRLRHLKTGRNLTTTFKGSENTESVFLESRPIQYLYNDGDLYYFMDTESYEQPVLSSDILGHAVDFWSLLLVVISISSCTRGTYGT